MSDSCPYCGVILDKTPRKSAECKECNNTYYVRKTHLFKTRILTKYQSDAAEFFEELMGFGVNVYEYMIMGEKLKEKWKRQPTYSDVLWALSNSGLVERGMRTFDKQESLRITEKAKQLSLAQAKYKRALGDDPRILLAIVNGYDIQYEKLLRETDNLYFEVIAADCCDGCLEQDGCVYSAGDIEDNEFIPSKLCTHKLHQKDKYPWCTCKYLVRI